MFSCPKLDGGQLQVTNYKISTSPKMTTKKKLLNVINLNHLFLFQDVNNITKFIRISQKIKSIND